MITLAIKFQYAANYLRLLMLLHDLLNKLYHSYFDSNTDSFE